MPKVSFIVPCYNLGHLLRECVDSILMQTFGDFEVLIMDDCSPDNTPDVARSFSDARVIHIRNEVNLGHLRNYNKGIDLARGEYVWQISADDRLRKNYILERYVGVTDKHPEIGYAICPAVSLYGDHETQVIKDTILGQQDMILNGRTFLRTLLSYNAVLVPACMVRKECFQKVSMFPLDLPYAGDWYLWCILALHYNVAYFAEPMVNYREHGLSMTNLLIRNDVQVLSRDDLAVRWRMKEKLRGAGCAYLLKHCKHLIVEDYVRNITEGYKASTCRMTWEEFDRSLADHVQERCEQQEIRGRVLGGVGDRSYWQNDLAEAGKWYELAVAEGASSIGLWMKCTLIRAGVVGRIVRWCIGNAGRIVYAFGALYGRVLGASMYGVGRRAA